MLDAKYKSKKDLFKLKAYLFFNEFKDNDAFSDAISEKILNGKLNNAPMQKAQFVNEYKLSIDLVENFIDKNIIVPDITTKSSFSSDIDSSLYVFDENLAKYLYSELGIVEHKTTNEEINEIKNLIQIDLEKLFDRASIIAEISRWHESGSLQSISSDNQLDTIKSLINERVKKIERILTSIRMGLPDSRWQRVNKAVFKEIEDIRDSAKGADIPLAISRAYNLHKDLAVLSEVLNEQSDAYWFSIENYKKGVETFIGCFDKQLGLPLPEQDKYRVKLNGFLDDYIKWFNGIRARKEAFSLLMDKAHTLWISLTDLSKRNQLAQQIFDTCSTLANRYSSMNAIGEELNELDDENFLQSNPALYAALSRQYTPSVAYTEPFNDYEDVSYERPIIRVNKQKSLLDDEDDVSDIERYENEDGFDLYVQQRKGLLRKLHENNSIKAGNDWKERILGQLTDVKALIDKFKSGLAKEAKNDYIADIANEDEFGVVYRDAAYEYTRIFQNTIEKIVDQIIGSDNFKKYGAMKVPYRFALDKERFEKAKGLIEKNEVAISHDYALELITNFTIAPFVSHWVDDFQFRKDKENNDIDVKLFYAFNNSDMRNRFTLKQEDELEEFFKEYENDGTDSPAILIHIQNKSNDALSV